MVGESSCTVRKSIFGTSRTLITDRPVLLTDKSGSVTDRPVARGLKLGSDTRVGNGHRNIKHV